jgi:hypothetical protein
MVKRISPCARDRAALRRLREAGRTPACDAVEQDYSACVVQKPWGHEFLVFETVVVAVWRLRIHPGHSTSMHCHPRKKTSLAVLAGGGLCHTLEARHTLGPYEALILDAGVFHSTKGDSRDGVDVIEVETPRCKTDLVRLNDLYGREGCGYEGSTAMHADRLERFGFFSFTGFSGATPGGEPTVYRDPEARFGVALQHFSRASAVQEWAASDDARLAIVLAGMLRDANGRVVGGVGDTVRASSLNGCQPVDMERPVLALTIGTAPALLADTDAGPGDDSAASVSRNLQLSS